LDRPDVLPFPTYAACRFLDTTPEDMVSRGGRVGGAAVAKRRRARSLLSVSLLAQQARPWCAHVQCPARARPLVHGSRVEVAARAQAAARRKSGRAKVLSAFAHLAALEEGAAGRRLGRACPPGARGGGGPCRGLRAPCAAAPGAAADCAPRRGGRPCVTSARTGAAQENGAIFEALRTMAACYLRADTEAICACIQAFGLNDLLFSIARLERLYNKRACNGARALPLTRLCHVRGFHSASACACETVPAPVTCSCLTLCLLTVCDMCCGVLAWQLWRLAHGGPPACACAGMCAEAVSAALHETPSRPLDGCILKPGAGSGDHSACRAQDGQAPACSAPRGEPLTNGGRHVGPTPFSTKSEGAAGGASVASAAAAVLRDAGRQRAGAGRRDAIDDGEDGLAGGGGAAKESADSTKPIELGAVREVRPAARWRLPCFCLGAASSCVPLACSCVHRFTHHRLRDS